MPFRTSPPGALGLLARSLGIDPLAPRQAERREELGSWFSGEDPSPHSETSTSKGQSGLCPQKRGENDPWVLLQHPDRIKLQVDLKTYLN